MAKKAVEPPISVRFKVGAHAGEVREVPRNVGLELASLGRVDVLPSDDFWYEDVQARPRGAALAEKFRDRRAGFRANEASALQTPSVDDVKKVSAETRSAAKAARIRGSAKA
jgi:hypothetical protein